MPLITTLPLCQIFSVLRNQIEVLLAYLVEVLNESWVRATTWLPEYRTELLRMGVGVGLFIVFIAMEIIRERSRSKEALKRVGNMRERRPRREGGRERKRENGSGDEEDEEELDEMTKTQREEFCKQLYKEWEGTLVGHWQICTANAMAF